VNSFNVELRQYFKKAMNRSATLKNIYVGIRIRAGYGIVKESLSEMSRILARNNSKQEYDKRSSLILTVPGVPSSAIVDAMLCAGLSASGEKPLVLVYDETQYANVTSEYSFVTEKSLLSGRQEKVNNTLNIPKIRNLWKKSAAMVVTLSDETAACNYRIEAYRNLELSDIWHYKHKGADIGEHVKAGVIRYYASGRLENEPNARNVAVQYLMAAIKVYDALERICSRENVKVVIVPNGIYVPAGIAQAFCKRFAINFVCWNIAYRERCVIFSHDDTYHHTLLGEPSDKWLNINLSTEMRGEITSYLRGRAGFGSRDWIAFNRGQRSVTKKELLNIFNITLSKVVTLLTNVNWDAQLHYPANAFSSMGEWIDCTLNQIALRPDVHFIIRIHPAEVSGDIPSRDRLDIQIRRRFSGKFPPNLSVVPPEASLSTYSICEASDAVIIYGTKTGVELVTNGIPVIVCGEAWIRNKGLTTDVNSKDEYISLINNKSFPSNIPKPDREKALRYAYHFFFRRMIFLKCFLRTNGEPRVAFRPSSNINIFEGDPGYKTIIDGIVTKSDFISTR